MVGELAEFLLTTPKTHINLKVITDLMKIIKRDYGASNASNTGLAIQQSGAVNPKTWATVAESSLFFERDTPYFFPPKRLWIICSQQP